MAWIFKIATDGPASSPSQFREAQTAAEKTLRIAALFNSELYGATSSEKTDHGGTVFRVGTDGWRISVCTGFGQRGQLPYESPILSGTTLYGVTTYGGSARDGMAWNLYRMSRTGSDFRVLTRSPAGAATGRLPHGTCAVGRAVYA